MWLSRRLRGVNYVTCNLMKALLKHTCSPSPQSSAEEILGTTTRTVDAWQGGGRGGGTSAPVFGRSLGLRGSYFSLCAPAGTQECPLLANNRISATRWHRSFPRVLPTRFSPPRRKANTEFVRTLWIDSFRAEVTCGMIPVITTKGTIWIRVSSGIEYQAIPCTDREAGGKVVGVSLE